MGQSDYPLARPCVGARLLFVAALALVAMFSASPEQVDAAEASTVYAVAAGVIELGPVTPVWHSSSLDLVQDETLPDPAAGAAGFLVVVDGIVLAENGQTGLRTFVQGNGALFLAVDDAVTLTALGDDAVAWRIAVVPEGASDPIARGEGVGRPVLAEGLGDDEAVDGAIRSIELRIGELSDGDEVQVGGDEETIPIACALFNSVIPGAGDSIREARCRATPEPDVEGPLRLFADDGDAVIAVVVVGSALDPDNLGGDEDREAEDDVDDDEADSASDSGGASEGGPSSGSANSGGSGAGAGGGNDNGDGNGDGSGNDGGDDGDGGDGGEEPPPDLSDLDTDGDGISDQFEIDNGMDINNPDSDGDELTDRQEVIELGLNTDPTNPDTDGDGLTDGQEVNGSTGFVTRPDMADSDRDNLTDGQEAEIGTNPFLEDTDGDGLSDNTDVFYLCDPLSTDTDGDGVNDEEHLKRAGDCSDPLPQ